ncbi:hypothetical protein EDD11_005888 [Mortierella claussenii]|nr:hypothetical protein EDD11_005888 [Mortierella claussenii]
MPNWRAVNARMFEHMQQQQQEAQGYQRRKKCYLQDWQDCYRHQHQDQYRQLMDGIKTAISTMHQARQQHESSIIQIVPRVV